MAGADMYAQALAQRDNARMGKYANEAQEDLELYQKIDEAMNSVGSAFGLASTFQNASKSWGNKKKIEATALQQEYDNLADDKKVNLDGLSDKQKRKAMESAIGEEGMERVKQNSSTGGYWGESLESVVSAREQKLAQMQASQRQLVDATALAQGKAQNDALYTRGLAYLKSNPNAVSMNDNYEMVMDEASQKAYQNQIDAIKNSNATAEVKSALIDDLTGKLDQYRRQAITASISNTAKVGYEALSKNLTDTFKNVGASDARYEDLDFNDDMDPNTEGIQSANSYLDAMMAGSAINKVQAQNIETDSKNAYKKAHADAVIARAVNEGSIDECDQYFTKSTMYTPEEKRDYKGKLVDRENAEESAMRNRVNSQFDTTLRNIAQGENPHDATYSEVLEALEPIISSTANQRVFDAGMNALRDKQKTHLKDIATAERNLLPSYASYKDLQGIFDSFSDGGRHAGWTRGLSDTDRENALGPILTEMHEAEKSLDTIQRALLNDISGQKSAVLEMVPNLVGNYLTYDNDGKLEYSTAPMAWKNDDYLNGMLNSELALYNGNIDMLTGTPKYESMLTEVGKKFYEERLDRYKADALDHPERAQEFLDAVDKYSFLEPGERKDLKEKFRKELASRVSDSTTAGKQFVESMYPTSTTHDILVNAEVNPFGYESKYSYGPFMQGVLDGLKDKASKQVSADQTVNLDKSVKGMSVTLAHWLPATEDFFNMLPDVDRSEFGTRADMLEGQTVDAYINTIAPLIKDYKDAEGKWDDEMARRYLETANNLASTGDVQGATNARATAYAIKDMNMLGKTPDENGMTSQSGAQVVASQADADQLAKDRKRLNDQKDANDRLIKANEGSKGYERAQASYQARQENAYIDAQLSMLGSTDQSVQDSAIANLNKDLKSARIQFYTDAVGYALDNHEYTRAQDLLLTQRKSDENAYSAELEKLYGKDSDEYEKGMQAYRSMLEEDYRAKSADVAEKAESNRRTKSIQLQKEITDESNRLKGMVNTHQITLEQASDKLLDFVFNKVNIFPKDGDTQLVKYYDSNPEDDLALSVGRFLIESGMTDVWNTFDVGMQSFVKDIDPALLPSYLTYYSDNEASMHNTMNLLQNYLAFKLYQGGALGGDYGKKSELKSLSFKSLTAEDQKLVGEYAVGTFRRIMQAAYLGIPDPESGKSRVAGLKDYQTILDDMTEKDGIKLLRRGMQNYAKDGTPISMWRRRSGVYGVAQSITPFVEGTAEKLTAMEQRQWTDLGNEVAGYLKKGTTNLNNFMYLDMNDDGSGWHYAYTTESGRETMNVGWSAMAYRIDNVLHASANPQKLASTETRLSSSDAPDWVYVGNGVSGGGDWYPAVRYMDEDGTIETYVADMTDGTSKGHIYRFVPNGDGSGGDASEITGVIDRRKNYGEVL